MHVTVCADDSDSDEESSDEDDWEDWMSPPLSDVLTGH